jgi:hypothetical protein
MPAVFYFDMDMEIYKITSLFWLGGYGNKKENISEIFKDIPFCFFNNGTFFSSQTHRF